MLIDVPFLLVLVRLAGMTYEYAGDYLHVYSNS